MKFRFAQVVMNAVALLALGGGMAAYLKSRSLLLIFLSNETIDFLSLSLTLLMLMHFK